MNLIRWIFFFTLAILLISSCNHAAAEFDSGQPPPAPLSETLPTG